MWLKFDNPLRVRARVAGAVETVVAMGCAMAVTVFFVAMVVFPDAIYAMTA
jgi:hypothetical protein